MKIKTIILLFNFFLLFSCKNQSESFHVQLKKTGEEIAFELDNRTKSNSRALFLYTDKEGKEYLTFQGYASNEIIFYDFESKKLAFKIKPEIDGNNGIGMTLGYKILNMDSIFFTNGEIEEIALIDTTCKLKEKFVYDETIEKVPLRRSYSTSFYYRPIYKIENKLYAVSRCNRKSKINPVSFTIDLETKEIKHLPFEYPKLQTKINPAKTAGSENYFSREYNGTHFIYSFSYEEDIYIASIDHKTITRKSIKSRYIDKLEPLNDFGNVTLRDLCEHAEYGNLLYDKYRNVYYRIVFPQTEVPIDLKDREYMDLLDYGRKCFSIIILDKDFSIIGETLFPDYTYNPTMAFIREDGLYISASHAFSENYSDDWLKFQRFELVKE